MGVHVHRQVEATAQRTDQFPRRLRTQQAGHVLDRQHVRTGFRDMVSQLQVVVQRVEILTRIGQVAGVAHRDFGYRRARFAYRVDRRAHRLEIVQRVENPENIDPRRGRFLDERRGDHLRIRRIPNGIAAPQQHLQADVGHQLAQFRQPLPRVFLQEAQRHIICRAAPRLHRQQLRGHPGHIGRNGDKITGSYARCQ